MINITSLHTAAFKKFSATFYEHFKSLDDNQNETGPELFNSINWLEQALIIITAIIFIASLVIHSKWMMPNHDVAWILVEAQYLLAGGRFYYDIQELNPPLIVFLSCPGVLIAHAASIDVWTGLMIWIHLLILLSIILALPTLRWTSNSKTLAMLPVFIYFISIIIPNYHFGQREHLTILLAAPALLLFSAQEAGRRNPSGETIILWLFASIGFLIKPFFLIIPSLLLLIRAAKKQDWRCIFGLESIILLISALTYTAIIFIKFPEWLITAKLAYQLYFAYNMPLLETLWSFHYSIICLLLVSSVLMIVKLPRSRRIFYLYLTFSASLFLILAVLQRKGFNYHAIATVALVTMIAGYLSLELISIKLIAPVNNWRLGLGVLLLGSSLVVLSARTLAGPGFTPLSEFLSSKFPTTVARIANNQSWFAISRGGLIPLSPSLLLINGFVGQRSSLQWMVPGIVMLSSGNPDEKIQAENLRKINTKNLIEDIRRLRPFIIGVEKVPPQVMTIPFDLFDFYNQDEDFRRIWKEYIQVEDIEGWRFFERKTNNGS